MPEIEPHPDMCFLEYPYREQPTDLWLVWLRSGPHDHTHLGPQPNSSHGYHKDWDGTKHMHQTHDLLLTPHSFIRILQSSPPDPVFLLPDEEDYKNLILLLGSTWDKPYAWVTRSIT